MIKFCNSWYNFYYWFT